MKELSKRSNAILEKAKVDARISEYDNFVLLCICYTTDGDYAELHLDLLEKGNIGDSFEIGRSCRQLETAGYIQTMVIANCIFVRTLPAI